MTDLLCRRYGAYADRILEMPASDGAQLLEYGFQQELDSKLFARWVAGPQFSLSFDEFKRQLMPPKFKRDEDVLDDTRKIMEAMHGNF